MFTMDAALCSYLLGNYALVACGMIVLVNHFMGNNTSDISKDLQILTCLSTFLRWFWSTDLSSDAPIWDEGHWMFRPMCYLELLISTVVWGMVVLLVRAPAKETKLPWYVRWYTCLIWSLSGPALLILNPDFWNPRVRFTHEAYSVPWNMALDTFGMLPQLYLLYSADSESLPASWVSHFVGLMCVDRVARILFWIGYFWNGPYLLSFIVPDVVHTLLMADYIYLWMKLVKTASAAQLGVDELMALEGDVNKDDEKKKDCYIFWVKSQICAMPRYVDQFLSSPSEALSKVWAIMRQGEKQVNAKKMQDFSESNSQFHSFRGQYSNVSDYSYHSGNSASPQASFYGNQMPQHQGSPINSPNASFASPAPAVNMAPSLPMDHSAPTVDVFQTGYNNYNYQADAGKRNDHIM